MVTGQVLVWNAQTKKWEKSVQGNLQVKARHLCFRDDFAGETKKVFCVTGLSPLSPSYLSPLPGTHVVMHRPSWTTTFFMDV